MIDKQSAFDEIFSGVWLWSFLLALTGGGVAIANQKYALGLSREMLLPVAVALATGLVIVIGLSQKLSVKSAAPRADQLRQLTVGKKKKCLLEVVIIDVIFISCLIYLFLYQRTLQVALLGMGVFLDVVLLFGVFRQYFAKSREV